MSKTTLHETTPPHARTTTHGTKRSNALRTSKKRRGSKPPTKPPNAPWASKKQRGSKPPTKRLLQTRTHLHPRSLRCCPLPPRMRPAPLPAAAPAHWLRLRHWPHWTPALRAAGCSAGHSLVGEVCICDVHSERHRCNEKQRNGCDQLFCVLLHLLSDAPFLWNFPQEAAEYLKHTISHPGTQPLNREISV